MLESGVSSGKGGSAAPLIGKLIKCRLGPGVQPVRREKCKKSFEFSLGLGLVRGMPRLQYHHDMDFGGFRNYLPPPPILHKLNIELQLQQLQYLRYSEPLELTSCPLDLSLKSQAPITPPCTPSPGSKRPRHESPDGEPKKRTINSQTTNKKTKVTRKLIFDEDNSSPVSGTIIRELGPDENLVVRKGDIDPAFNVVEITEEAKAELAKIENHIGDYVCRLCKELYEDAFGLAQHRCSRIVHVEYRCPECDKVFNCPANLASHRRWHKPRPNKDTSLKNSEENADSETTGEMFPCLECGKRFRRVAYLRKHQTTHQID